MRAQLVHGDVLERRAVIDNENYGELANLRRQVLEVFLWTRRIGSLSTTLELILLKIHWTSTREGQMHRQSVEGEISEMQRPETKSSSLCTRTGHGLRETEPGKTRTPSDRGIMSEVTNELRQNKAYAEATRVLGGVAVQGSRTHGPAVTKTQESERLARTSADVDRELLQRCTRNRRS